MESTKKKVSINLEHQFCGHVGEYTILLMLKALEFELTSSHKYKYLSFSMAKAKQKNVPKKSLHETLKKKMAECFGIY